MSSVISNFVKSATLQERAKSDEFDAEAYSNLEGTWDRMMAHFHFHAKCIIRFAKKIPGFRDLHIDDQVCLLRGSTYVLVVLSHARSYELEGEFYNFFNFTFRETEKVLEFFPELQLLPGHFLEACRLAHVHNLSDLEYAFLSCILLLDADCMGLVNVMALKELKTFYLDFFNQYELEKLNSTARFEEIMQYLSGFSEFSLQHNQSVGKIMVKHPQLNIPQLYAEMYNP